MKKVLVIDDELSVARLVRAALERASVSHTLEFCTDGGQGKAKAAQGQYDLITLDLAMPLMDGVEALREIKANPKSAEVPVIVITARNDPAVHEQVKEMGAAAVVTKPFEIWELVNVLRLVLASDQAEQRQGERGNQAGAGANAQ